MHGSKELLRHQVALVVFLVVKFNAGTALQVASVSEELSKMQVALPLDVEFASN